MPKQEAPEITWEEVSARDPASIILVDVRDEIAYQHGSLPGAVCLDRDTILADAVTLPAGKTVICFCMWGVLSKEAADHLCSKGVCAYSLKGGYAQWLRRELAHEAEDTERRDKIEESLRRKFHKELFTPFAQAVCRYNLVEPGDKIAVCISGGKDSMLMAKLFQELKRHNKFPFELVFLVMDPGYSPVNRAVIESNAKLLGVPIQIFETDIFESVFHVEKSPCYLCARMRRGHLYHQAQQLGCNKIALGHHYDDVIETTLMSMLYGAEVRTMMPKLHSQNFAGMELIRPLYLIREDDIKRWRDYHHLHFIQCACKFTDSCTTCHTDGTTSSKRLEIKNLIRRMKQDNPQVESNLFKSMENVNLDTVISYRKGGKTHHFLEEY
ncbi:MAG: ATPase [Faecalibacterium sp.]|jgi:tRNA(Ile)-lysidine synthase TilS/MesJ|nr:ATPase [Faecalibacterium sp.]